MSPRTLPSIPLIRKPRFPGSPSIRDVKPEHKYLVRANRRLLTREILNKPFKLLFNKARAEERECREKIQEEVVDYRGTGQSPKRKAAESTTIRSLTRSLCSLPRRRARPAQILVSFDVAMDDDFDEDDSMDLDDTADFDFDMGDSSFDMDVDVKTTPIQFITGIPGLVYPPFVPSLTAFPGFPWLVYPPFIAPHPEISELAQLMSALCVSPPPPPPYAPAPAPAMPAQAPAPSFPPGLQVPAAEASKAAKAEEAAPSAAAPVANGAASKGKAAEVLFPWKFVFQKRWASKASGRGPSEASTSAPAPAAAAAEPEGEGAEVKTTSKSSRHGRKLATAVDDHKKARKNNNKGF
ncbi:hypothetical protein PsYK624_156070 [Phanerochaete sordida]|uniref:Uncharacterized protein n=1 Tax=Phanerochaete sordida TaxID=48140 RepID=A0A9P3GQR4_9APHY|nr:hypothetical protein PsYK624_156070 [Phanerochaete sordida]